MRERSSPSRQVRQCRRSLRAALLLVLAASAGPWGCAGLRDETVPPAGGRWPAAAVSVLEVFMGCSERPQALGEWFPEHHLGALVSKRLATDPTALAKHLAPMRCLAGALLRSAREQPLATGSPLETYRVLWIPSFRPPSVARIEVDATGAARATVKTDVSEGASLSGEFTVRLLELSPQSLARVRAAVSAARCWPTADHTCHAEFLAKRGEGWIDGADCIVEGARPGVHWGILLEQEDLASAGGGAGEPIQALCQELLEVVGVTR